MQTVNTVGRRKCAVARVYASEGGGGITVNDRSLESYFPVRILQIIVKQPLYKLELDNRYDFKIRVNGGGIKGQAEAIRLGISRALVAIDQTYRAPLKEEKFLTRDPRMVERKKYGQRKARRKFQFSKR